MKHKLVNESAGRVLVFDEGDHVMEVLRAFAQEKQIVGGRFSGIGAFSELTLGYYDAERRDFNQIVIDEQVEVLTLTGNIAFTYAQPKIHAHVIVGKSDGTAWGGHLIEGKVRPTLELLLTEYGTGLQRMIDEETGLARLKV